MSANLAARGRNVTSDFLADRAKFVRLETLRLARICGSTPPSRNGRTAIASS